MIGTWIDFVPTGTSKSKKTKIFAVMTKEGSCLGTIKWYGGWRKYCFFPTMEYETLYENICLMEISQFLKNMTDAHRINMKEVKA